MPLYRFLRGLTAPWVLMLCFGLLGCGTQIRALRNSELLVDRVTRGFVDLFDGSTFNPVWSDWIPGFLIMTVHNPAVDMRTTSGRLVFTFDATTPGYQALVTPDTYDFTDSSASVEIAVPPSSGSTVTEVGLWIIQGDNDLAIGWQTQKMGTALYFVYFDGAAWDYAGANQAVFDPVVHRFLRIRHDDGLDSMVWEASPDETVWTVLRVKPLIAENVGVMRMSVYGGAWAVEPSPSIPAELDHFRTDAVRN